MSQSNQLAVYPYLNFNGNCREAMTFYNESLGGELHIMDFEGSSMDNQGFKGVMHATLQRDGLTLLASDSHPEHPIEFGTSVHVSVNCTSREQVDDFFGKLSQGGKINMPLQDTFWGAYFGMFTDKFGIHWMFNYDTPHHA